MTHKHTSSCPLFCRGKWTAWLTPLLAVFVFLHIGVQSASAQMRVASIGADDSYTLSDTFSYFKDDSASLSFAQVQEPGIQAQFQSVAKNSAASNFGTTTAAIWLRLQLQTSTGTPSRWLLEVANPGLDEIDVFVVKPGGQIEQQLGGDLRPFSERAVAHRNHVKQIELLPDSLTTLYIRVAGSGNVAAPVKLWQPEALWRNDQTSYLIFGLYFGLLVGLFLYNLLLYFTVRDTVYLIYVVFVAGTGMAQAVNSGLAAQYFWPTAVWWNDISINVAYAVSGTFGIWFAIRFLNFRQYMPTWNRIFRSIVALWVVLIFLAILLSHRTAGLMMTVLALVSICNLILSALWAIRKGYPGARNFGLAWGAFLFGIVVLLMYNYGLLPPSILTAHAMLIGSATEMVLLSFALADRINIAQRETELAKAQARSDQFMLQALQQAQERHRSVIEHVGEGMVVVQNERIVFVNARAAEILEMNKGEITREGIFSRMQPDTASVLIDRVRRRVAGLDVPERSQVRWEYADKRVKWLEFGDNLVPWNDGQGLLIFFVDVTERYEAEMEVRTALDRQQELNTLRSRFIAITSHEFRTPLSAILSAKDLLQNFGDRLPDAQKSELLGMIDAAVHRMTRMLERVLLLGQAESKMLDFKPQMTDVKALCQDLVEEARTLQPDSTCQLVLDLPDGPLTSLLDTQLMRHIFSNLLSNALKYSPSGGVVRLKAYGRDGQTVFEVSDQGIGVPAEEMANLFDSFHRASNVGAIAGTGLGLAIVKQTVDLHGGRIEVQSSPGAGTTFTVIL